MDVHFLIMLFLYNYTMIMYIIRSLLIDTIISIKKYRYNYIDKKVSIGIHHW